ncbi:isoprenylcysteine carboxylmethyltransferase family protein [Olivibacter sp. SDN3]|uniref:methyltransferase family protein n=1 Tax=Olivibacter sp. SDN3 TaxID=2764720 RepID=UPI001650F395|nr:isoprenylcysteine carboxylmethyltransferase family protein [Olivibacter sp. SDN3]QNL48736.1 isoprenylcysteine carboxylmethyltransferase family protein [Olivibacter sp. SDN3]
MISLFFRNLLFTILQPGVVAALLPYLILGNRITQALGEPFNLRHFAALAVFVFGFIIMLVCIGSFAIYGRGTLSPADPTKKLVVQGLYRYSRNPMYVGIMLMLIGEGFFFGSGVLWAYTLIIFILFNIFIRYFEEPRLMRDFGAEYTHYRQRVGMWL